MHRALVSITTLIPLITACTTSDVDSDNADDTLGLGCCKSDPAVPEVPEVPESPPQTGPIVADVTIDVLGTGLGIGIDPKCGLTLAAQFVATASGKAELGGNQWTLVELDPSIALTIGNGCACTGISVSAIASVKVHAEIEASLGACQNYCSSSNQFGSCMDLCLQPGNILRADATLDASLGIQVNASLDLNGLVGKVIDLGNWVLCNAAGVAL